VRPSWPTDILPCPCARTAHMSCRCRCHAARVRGVARRTSVPSTHIARPHHLTGCPYVIRSPSSFPIFRPRESFSLPLYCPISVTMARPHSPPFSVLLASPPLWPTHALHLLMQELLHCLCFFPHSATPASSHFPTPFSKFPSPPPRLMFPIASSCRLHLHLWLERCRTTVFPINECAVAGGLHWWVPELPELPNGRVVLPR
jgi:hypothetical protein